MNRYPSRKRIIGGWLAFLLLAVILPMPIGTPVALAQSVPAACLTDSGQVVVPAPIVGAWAMVLNFNHPLSATTTTGCRITTIALQPTQQIAYNLVTCPLVNNSGGGQVGGGAATFDGNFWLSCPNGLPAAPPPYTGFLIHGRMQFVTSAAIGTRTFTLFQHPDVDFTAELRTNTLAKLTSRYGFATYQTGGLATNATSAPVSLGSAIGMGLDQHRVNGSSYPFTTPISTFGYDFTKPFTIGAAGQRWTLYEMVVDPPPPRGSFSG